MSTRNAKMRELQHTLMGLRESAYGQMIEAARQDGALIPEYKIDQGLFDFEDLEAHKEVAKLYGRHNAYENILNLVTEMLETRRSK